MDERIWQRGELDSTDETISDESRQDDFELNLPNQLTTPKTHLRHLFFGRLALRHETRERAMMSMRWAEDIASKI